MATILNLAILDSATLVFSSQTHSHLPRLVPTICTKKPSLTKNHSDSTWWWQPSWILPCWIKKTSLIDTDSTWWWQPSWILPCWIQTPCFLLSDSLKNTLTPLWLWLKLIQSDSNSFILTQLAILNLAIMDSATLVFPLKLTHTCQDGFPPFAQKNLHSFILTQLDDGSHLEFYHVGFRHLLIFSQIHSKTLSLHSDSWLKLIQSDSNLFIFTQLDDGSHLEFCHLEFGHLGFSHLSFSSQTHSHLPGLVPTICTKKLHSFILTQLDDGSHLEFFCCWIKKTSLIHSDSTWWWQPSWILPCWIQTPCFLLSDSLKNTLTPLWLWLKLIQSDSNSFILTQLDDGSHLEFGHLGFSHLVFPLKLTHTCQDWFPPFAQKKPSLIHSDSTWWWQPSWILPCWIQTPCFLLSDSLKNTLTPLWLLTQTNSIWLKLIHSHSTWWWQPSWILPSWIWSSWIQPS